MFKTRLLSGIVLVILLLLFIIPGGNVTAISMCLVSIIGMSEIYGIYNVKDKAPGIIGYIFCVLYYLVLVFTDGGIHNIAIIMAFLIAVLAVYVFTYPKYDATRIMATFFGLFYVAVMLSFVYLLRIMPGGQYLVWLIILCSWGCDTLAYCSGMLLGKHKMAPVLSPKKSVEGAIGGVLGAFLLTFIYLNIFKTQMSLDMNHIIMVSVFAAIGGLISMVGDLAASAIKRNNNIKDYGKLIPGHGGILDRFDSVIITAPIVYFLCYYYM